VVKPVRPGQKAGVTGPESTSIAHALAVAARQLAAERDVDRTLRAMLLAAVESVPGAELAGVSVLERGRVVSMCAQSDPLISEIDQLQTSLQEGPCLQVMLGDPRVVSNDLGVDPRWPGFAAQAVAQGVRSVLSLRLELERTSGTLSLFARHPEAFSPDSEVIGGLFAVHAAIALAGVQREHQLSQALHSRDTMGMAKGIVMAQHHLSEQQAFSTLVRLSQTENVKLIEVATRLVQLTEQEAAQPLRR
jgi:GAF domain-containing protein